MDDVVTLARPVIERNSVELITERREDLPPVNVDAMQVTHALLNLIINGVEAMLHPDTEERKLKVSTQCRDGINIEITVSDTGPGIPEELQETIFEQFFSTKGTGMGLGLKLCRDIIEAHNGSLLVESEAGNGCTFHVKIPAIITIESDTAELDVPTVASGRADQAPAAQQPVEKETNSPR